MKNICCRTSFLQNQLLSQSQNHSFEFKHLSLFPRTPINDFNIKKTICGMLNCFGGYLFLGVEQDKYDQSHRIKGYTLNESSKENIKKYFNQISECFYPIVDTSKKDILVEFVRVEGKREGVYVVKVGIQKGKENGFYSFKHRVGEGGKGGGGYGVGEIDVNLHFKRYDNESKLVSSMGEVYREILERSRVKGEGKRGSLCQCGNVAQWKGKQQKEQISSDQDDNYQKNNLQTKEIIDNKNLNASTKPNSFSPLQPMPQPQPSSSPPLPLDLNTSCTPSQTQMYSYISQDYSYTSLTNVPAFYQQDVQEFISHFDLAGFTESEEVNGLKSYKIPLESREDHRKFRKMVNQWLVGVSCSLHQDIEVKEVGG